MTFYHVTVCSNLCRGYDKYSRTYRKDLIPESRYPGVFFLLTKEDLGIGIEKARRLLHRLNYRNDRVVVLEHLWILTL